jgi:sulfoxide reductase heme-binding subunit YedZ
MVVGLQVHFRGRMWFYFVREVEETGALVFRSDLFGFANYTGLLSALGLVLLLVLSNDRSLRRLRSGRWKGLQRWNYAVFALAAFHAVAYQVIEKRAVEYAILLGILLIPTVFLQLLGFRTRWRERARE